MTTCPSAPNWVPAPAAARRAWASATLDTNRKKFTGYERDTETGLDFAQARYYSNTQGRFTSPDPLMASAKATDPQSWNRYSYVGNNPMVFSDPSGLARGPAQFHGKRAEIDHAREAGQTEVSEQEAYYEDRLAGKYDSIVETVEPIDGALEHNEGGTAEPSPWAGWIHSAIIDEAFPGLRGSQRRQIKQAGADLDEDLSTEGAYKHAMRAPNQPELVAWLKAIVFGYGAMRDARDLQREYLKSGGSGFSDKALYEVGKVVHLLTDSTSPEHTGFQVWHGWNSRLNKIRGVAHGLGESRINDAQKKDAVNMARAPFSFVFGQRLTKQAFQLPNK